MDMAFAPSDLVKALSEKLNCFKEQNPNLSSAQLAKRFGVSGPTLCRIENLDTRAPSMDQIAKILSGTGGQRELLGFLEQDYPEIVYSFKQIYGDHNRVWISEEIQKWYAEPRFFRILILFNKADPINREKFIELYGSECVKDIEKLKVGNMIVEDERGDLRKVHFRDEQFSDPEVMREVVKNLINEFLDLSTKDSNALFFKCKRRVDAKKVVPQMKILLRQYLNQVETLLNDPQNLGEDSVFYIASFDKLYKGESND